MESIFTTWHWTTCHKRYKRMYICAPHFYTWSYQFTFPNGILPHWNCCVGICEINQWGSINPKIDREIDLRIHRGTIKEWMTRQSVKDETENFSLAWQWEANIKQWQSRCAVKKAEKAWIGMWLLLVLVFSRYPHSPESHQSSLTKYKSVTLLLERLVTLNSDKVGARSKKQKGHD